MLGELSVLVALTVGLTQINACGDQPLGSHRSKNLSTLVVESVNEKKNCSLKTFSNEQRKKKIL